MGWLELQAWLEQLTRTRKRAQGRDQTDTDSWRGQEGDSWWEEQRRLKDKLRGR